MGIDGAVVLSQYVDKSTICDFGLDLFGIVFLSAIAIFVGFCAIVCAKSKDRFGAIAFSCVLIIYIFLIESATKTAKEDYNDIGNMVYKVEIQNKYAYVEVDEKYDILENIINDIYLVREK